MKAIPPGALPAAAAPYVALAAALRHVDDEGLSVPCDGSLWPTSDDVTERAHVAANWCPGCPVLHHCREAGLQERHGVWGGVDRGARTAKGSRS